MLVTKSFQNRENMDNKARSPYTVKLATEKLPLTTKSVLEYFLRDRKGLFIVFWFYK